MTDGRRAGPLFIEADLECVFGANAGPVGQPCLEPECELGCRGPHSWGEGFPRVEGKVEHIWAVCQMVSGLVVPRQRQPGSGREPAPPAQMAEWFVSGSPSYFKEEKDFIHKTQHSPKCPPRCQMSSGRAGPHLPVSHFC